MIRFTITQLVMTMLNSNNNCKIGINVPKLTFLITENMQIAGINDFILDQNDFKVINDVLSNCQDLTNRFRQ
jgi:hypothetical protein